MIENMKIAFLGTGFMATALVDGLTKTKTVQSKKIIAINPHKSESYHTMIQKYGVKSGEKEDLKTADIVVFAFKPQGFIEAMQMYKPYFNEKSTFISIMAGITTATIEKHINAPVIRSMPNLALSVSLSATAFCLGKNANDLSKQIATEFFSPLGVVSVVVEDLISTVTALSGSGPAYFYYLCEAMASAAQTQGMDEKSANMLAVQTLIGTAKLIENSGDTAQEMRAKITSKKGTTESAVNAFCENGFFDVIEKGMNAAKERSDELSKMFE